MNSDREHVNNGGNLCPWCGSDKIEADDLTFEGGSVSQAVYCQKCGKWWYDVYRLIGYEAPYRQDQEAKPKDQETEPRVFITVMGGLVEEVVATSPMRVGVRDLDSAFVTEIEPAIETPEQLDERIAEAELEVRKEGGRE